MRQHDSQGSDGVEDVGMDNEIRTLTNEDASVLWKMLIYAAHESSLEAVQNQPGLVRYVSDWGRSGDLGLVAWVNQKSVGAVWLRQWVGEDKGFGYLDDAIPELAIAVHPEYRNQGIGQELLSRIIKIAQSEYPAISLSVRAENPAVRLYERAGFVKVEGSESVNRTGGVSFNMICRLGRSPIAR